MKLVDTLNETRFKALIYGKTGSGKTSLTATCERPLVLLTERQGLLHLREACARNDVPVPPVLFLDTLQDFRDVAHALHGDRDNPFRVTSGSNVVYEGEWPETVVIDSLTAAGQMLADELDALSPPKPGKDGLPARHMRVWGVLGERFAKLVMAYRDAPVDVLFLALAQDRETGDEHNRTREIKPQLPMSKLGEQVAAMCNCAGYAYRSETKERGVQWGVMFHGPEFMLTKACGGLRSHEPPSYSAWKGLVFGSLGDAPEQPAPSIESAAGVE